MIPVTDQINAVFSAPIPFFLTLGSVLTIAGVAMWRLLEWAYRAKYEKTNTLFELARSEATLITEAAKRKEAELTETMTKMRGQIDSLSKKKEAVPADVQLLIENVSSSSAIANKQLIELKGNLTAASEAFKSGYRGTEVGTPPSGPLPLRDITLP
jgi:hypothetical protein